MFYKMFKDKKKCYVNNVVIKTLFLYNKCFIKCLKIEIKKWVLKVGGYM